MYDNIGRKIKGLAKGLFVIEAIGTIVAGIAILTIDDDFILHGLLMLIWGPLVAWVSSWVLYAFGELVEDVHALRNQKIPTEQHDHTSMFIEDTKASEQQFAPTLEKGKCELCGKKSENLRRCKINDTVGWADLCEECATKY